MDHMLVKSDLTRLLRGITHFTEIKININIHMCVINKFTRTHILGDMVTDLVQIKKTNLANSVTNSINDSIIIVLIYTIYI